MGATSSTAANSARLPAGVNNLVGELGSDVQYERGMGSSRFLKAIKARHKHGPLVVKTFVKPDAMLSLRPLVRRIRVEREALADVPNTLTYQKVVETETAGYLIRQWMSTNLYDRISTRPFLTAIEKKWVTFQLLSAMKEARKRNVPHGDLKSENVLVTSSLSVFVTDFASSFKQVHLPLNDPSDFNFYFGTSGRRTCYIAPERFYAEDSDIAKQKAKARSEVNAAEQRANSTQERTTETTAQMFKRDGHVTEAMDVFSMGCVIAELWRDGAPIFTLMQLFKYRERQFDIEPALMEIADTHIRSMVRSMLSLDPDERKSFADYLDRARGACFPDSFYVFLHRYLTTLQRTSARTSAMAAAEASAAAAAASAAILAGQGSLAKGATSAAQSSALSDAGTRGGLNEIGYLLRAEADERIERMYEEWSVVTRVLDGGEEGWEASMPASSGGGDEEVAAAMSPRMRDFTPTAEQGSDSFESSKSQSEIQDVLPVRLCIPGIAPSVLSQPQQPVKEDGPALLILSPLLANMRNALRPSTKLHCFDLLLHLSARWLSNEAKLDRALPYLVTMLDDESVAVRMAAVRTVVQLLALVDVITPSNASTFAEYVMPNLRPLTRDPSSLVRAMYAACLVELTRIGTRYLQLTSAMRAEGVFAADTTVEQEVDDFLEGDTRPEDEVNIDRQMDVLRAFFHEQATLLLTDSSPVVKRSLLADIGPLCVFFGSTMTNDVILSHMITYLNDRSWMLRKAFFDTIVDVARIAGARSVEDYILTLLLQALSDPEEFVVLHVLQVLRRMLDDEGTGTRLLSQTKVLDVVGASAGFLCHPNHWLRMASALLIAAGAAQLGSTDVWCLLYPSIRPLLRSDVESITARRVLFAVKDPLSREVLQKAVQWAFRARNSRFWKPPASEAKGKAGLGNSLGREGIGLMLGRRGKDVSRTAIARNEEDDAYFDSLRSSGLSEDDEVKLVALREYITKLARMSNLIGGPSVKTVASAPLSNTEDANILPPLQIKSTLAVQPLDDVTPLTIFFTTRTSTSLAHRERAGLDTASMPASVRSHAADSTFSGRMARRRLAGSRIVSDTSVMSPLDELRRRMNEANDDVLALPLSAGPVPLEMDNKVHADEIARPDSPLSILSGGGGVGAAAQVKVGLGKAHAAIASDTTNATGTMADAVTRAKAMRVKLADDSGRTTPTGTATPTVRDHAAAATKRTADVASGEPAFASTYEGNDPYVRAHLEAVYLANFQDRHPGWGPTVSSAAPSRRRGGGVGVRAATAGARAAGVLGAPSLSVSSNRRPEGRMISYFTEHTAAITAIAVSPDHAFFLSGSEDGTLKVWDTARLEKNVTSRSRGTYSSQRGKIVCVIMLAGSHCAASAATDGSVHVIRVEVVTSSSSLPKYGKIRLVSNFQLSDPDEHVVCMVQSARRSGQTTREAAHATASGTSGVGGAGGPSMTGGTTVTGSTLILATSKSHIVILDLRTMQVLTNFYNPPHLGAVTTMCVDPKNIWLLVATVGGVMCLWDLRFHLLVKTWRLSTLEGGRKDDEATSAAGEDGAVVRVNAVTLHPTRGDDRWVMIAYERLNLSFVGEQHEPAGVVETLIETWDIDRAVCVEVYETLRSDTPAAARNSAGDDAQQQQQQQQHVVSLSTVKRRSDALQSHVVDDRFFGLQSAAEAIERLVKLHDERLDRQQVHDEDRESSPIEHGGHEAAAASEEERGKHRRVKGREIIPPPAPTSYVRAMLVSTEGYVSSALPHHAHVGGGWVDAGKLVAGAEGNATTTARAAGYMITAGMDRKIRFWDLGRVEKSTSFGAATDERSEFRVRLPSEVGGSNRNGGGQAASEHRRDDGVEPSGSGGGSGGGAAVSQAGRGASPSADAALHATHYTHQTLHTPATARSAASALRSPLLTHHSATSTTTMLMKAHKDAITALGIIESPFRCIVAGDYAGNIRVWE